MNSTAFIVGYLPKDAELKETKAGKVLKFSVASREQRKVNGNWEEYTEWYNCTIFRKEKLAPHFVKGTFVVLDGSRVTSEYEVDGVKKSSVEYIVFNIRGFVSKKDSPPVQKMQDPVDDDWS